MFALFGAIPTEPAPVSFGGTPNMLARWSRFVDTARPYLQSVDPDDRRVWRFTSAEGVFDNAPVGGVLRVSETSRKDVGILAILASTPAPGVGDPWFDAAEKLLKRVTEAMRSTDHLRRQISVLVPPSPQPSHDAGARFWIEDWEVHELHFPTIQELATDGFAQMLSPRPLLETG